MPIVNKGALHKASKDFLKDLDIPTETKKVLDNYLESYEDEFFQVVDGIFTHFGMHDALAGLIDTKNKTIVGQHHQVLITILLGLAIGLIGGAVNQVAQPVMDKIGQGINQQKTTKLPDPNFLLRYLRLYPAQRGNMLDKMAQQGYSAEHTDLMFHASDNFLAPDMMIRAWHRGLVAENQVDEYMRLFGFGGFDAKTLKSLSDVIPPIQDLISMAVREAFNETAVARFKLDANFPDAILPYAKAQGLSKEWVTRYWRAHWQLPSIQQGFEMFQRLRPGKTQSVFTEADLSELMITADIPEFFRTRLKEIAYNPITRVDIRRLYKMGIFKEAQVLSAYQDIGYSLENATSLTRFTVLDAVDDGGELTKAQILKAFREGLYTEAQASLALQKIPLNQQIVLFEISMVKHELNVERVKADTTLYTQQFVNGLIDNGTLIVRLNSLGLTASHIQVLIAKAQYQRDSRVVLPTKTDIQSWYEQRIISDFEFSNYMIRLGYSLADVQKYLRALNTKIAKAAQSDYEDAVAAQDKLVEKQIADNYRHQIAFIDVQIAQYHLAIANLKKLLIGEENVDTVEQYNKEIKEFEVKIKEQTLAKARVKTN